MEWRGPSLETGLASKGWLLRFGMAIVKLESSPSKAWRPKSADMVWSILRNGAEWDSSSSGGCVNGTTIVRFSSLDGLNIGLPIPPALVLDFGEGLGKWLSPRDLLLAVEATAEPGAPIAAGVRVFVAVDVLDLDGLPAGLIVGVACAPARLLAAYGSAVAGRANSGLRGRRTGAAIRVPEVELLGA